MNSIWFAPVIAIVMLSLGLSLTVADFKRVRSIPRPIGVALFCQTLVLPALCFCIVKLYALPPVLAVGLMLTAAAPGGTMANILSHLAGGDLALNLTLTAINSILAIVTLPLTVAFSMAYFMDEGRTIPLQYGKALQVFLMLFLPIAIGMFLRHHYPQTAERFRRPVKIMTGLLVLAIAVPALFKEREMLRTSFSVLGPAVFSLNIISLAVGYLVPRLMKLDSRQAIAISLEIGLHNAALAITIASSPQLLGNSEIAVPAALYGVVTPLVAMVLILAIRSRSRKTAAV